jgi:hypothetical protein
MRTIAIARAAAVAVVAQMLIHGSAYSQQSTKSEWVGGSRLFGQPAALSLKLRSDSAGVANAPQWRVTNRALSYVRETGDSLIFTFPSTREERATGTEFMERSVAVLTRRSFTSSISPRPLPPRRTH